MRLPGQDVPTSTDSAAQGQLRRRQEGKDPQQNVIRQPLEIREFVIAAALRRCRPSLALSREKKS